MPDSEPKTPAKKAAKKAAKTPAKKAVAKKTAKGISAEMSAKGKRVGAASKPAETPEPSPEATEALGEPAVDYQALAQAIGDKGNLPAVLTGDCTVRLVNEFDNARTPAHAVEKFIEWINDYGLRSMIFVVIDEETGMTYAVDGRGTTLDLPPS